MRYLKFLHGAAAFLMIVGCLTAYTQAPPALVSFDRLVDAPLKFDGKLVRVRGFVYVETHPHDVGIIALYPSQEQAAHPTRNLGIFINFKDPRIGRESIRTGWAEITGRFRAVPTAGRGHVLGLTQVQKFEELSERAESH